MRGRTRYAGAMLLYGPQQQPPDLTLAMQFLMDDLRFEGRTVTWIALKSGSLRLRVEGYELVLAHASEPLPPQAFHGTYRPAKASTEGADEADDSTDLARGRVLHSLRQHRCALSVLLRPRGAAVSDDPHETLLTLVRECRAMIEPVIEAAPPSVVLWQPGAVAFTCAEFLTSRAEELLVSGNRANLLQFDADAEKPRYRPALAFGEPVAPKGLAPAQPAEICTQTQPAGEVHLPAVISQLSARSASAPHSRSERAAKRSAGQLFASTGRASARPIALPRLHRQDVRLAQAMRAVDLPEVGKAAITSRRRINLARAANCAAMILWFVVLLEPLVGWI